MDCLLVVISALLTLVLSVHIQYLSPWLLLFPALSLPANKILSKPKQTQSKTFWIPYGFVTPQPVAPVPSSKLYRQVQGRAACPSGSAAEHTRSNGSLWALLLGATISVHLKHTLLHLHCSLFWGQQAESSPTPKESPSWLPAWSHSCCSAALICWLW